MSRYARAQHEHDMGIVAQTLNQIEPTLKQFYFDCTCLALHRDFGFGADRLKRFHDSLQSVCNHFNSRMFYEGKIRNYLGEKLDSDFELARSEMDRALREIFGEDFDDFDTRYK